MHCDYFILSGLNEYTTYSVSVAANNSFGIGPYSQPVQVKTQESSKFVHQRLPLLLICTYDIGTKIPQNAES